MVPCINPEKEFKKSSRLMLSKFLLVIDTSGRSGYKSGKSVISEIDSHKNCKSYVKMLTRCNKYGTNYSK